MAEKYFFLLSIWSFSSASSVTCPVAQSFTDFLVDDQVSSNPLHLLWKPEDRMYYLFIIITTYLFIAELNLYILHLLSYNYGDLLVVTLGDIFSRAFYKELLYLHFPLASLLINIFPSLRHHCLYVLLFYPKCSDGLALRSFLFFAIYTQSTTESLCFNHRASSKGTVLIMWFIGRLMLFLNSVIFSLKAYMWC